MGKTWGKVLLLLSGMLLAAGAQAQYGGAPTAARPNINPFAPSVRGSNLVPYLQAERDAIAVLTAQQHYLLQRGDTVGALLVGSYVPDHQLQASLLAQEIRDRGGNPDAVQANVPNPFLGSTAEILAYNSQQQAWIADQYRRLTGAGTADSRYLAQTGLSGAERHFASLQVALGARDGSPAAVLNSLRYALQLERTAMADLQAQAAQLRRLNDPQTADRLVSLIPAHQQQEAQLISLIQQLGGNPATVGASTVAALPTRDAILMHRRAMDVQMANTYATHVAAFPSTSPLHVAGLQGQRNALTAIAVLFGGPLPTA
ncbi:MAG TPA: hypothetical protein PK794_06875 [Armatimonadota bacterium]|nr:hypothetical protein [Armatimonadota bacterium]